MVLAKIWKFFAKVTENGQQKRKCLKCGELLSTPKDFSTSSMIKHLKSKGHEAEWKAYSEENFDEPIKITSFFAQHNSEMERQLQMDEQLVRIMVRQNASLYFFDDADVQEMARKAFPGLKVI
ncbi:MAG: zinc finger BED domain-containing protein [Ginsengibacter sp.]